MRAPLLLFTALALNACAAPVVPAEATPPVIPAPAYVVSDLTAFDAFIASQPTPEQFRARYPDVALLLPGSIATKELRLNRSRYFATLNAEGRITGGRFG